MPGLGGASTQPKLSSDTPLARVRSLGRISIASKQIAQPMPLGHPLIGDPLLRTERSTQHEIYYASSGKSSWPTRITLFSAR